MGTIDLFYQPLLLDMIFLGTPKLCGGVDIFFFKVSFEKHPSVHTCPPHESILKGNLWWNTGCNSSVNSRSKKAEVYLPLSQIKFGVSWWNSTLWLHPSCRRMSGRLAPQRSRPDKEVGQHVGKTHWGRGEQHHPEAVPEAFNLPYAGKCGFI